MGSDPDFHLLERWRSGDRNAGDELVTKHYSQVRRFFTNSVHDDQFQDLTNETFKRLTISRDSFKGVGSVRTFLFVIAKRVLCDHLRKRYRDDAQGFDPMTHSVEDVRGATPSRAVAQLEEYRRLLSCLRALPVDTKLLLELYYWNSCTADELAKIYEIAPGTVRTRIHSARKRLERCCADGQSRGRDPAADDEIARDLRAMGRLFMCGPSGL